MHASHELILLGGVLGLVSIFAGVLSSRLGAPLLLVFLVLGMLAGEDGPGGIQFGDFGIAYFIGSIALATILFEGGLKTPRAVIRDAWAPSLLLATLGVALTAGAMAGLLVLVTRMHWPLALLTGAVVAPTDAAAIALLLRRSGLQLPRRVQALLELESGLNDPMSVFLVLLLVDWLRMPAGTTVFAAALGFVEAMGGGALWGLVGGRLLAWSLRRLKAEHGLYPILAFAGTLVIFGGAQSIGASGFLAVYLAGIIVGDDTDPAAKIVDSYFEVLGWFAQIALFLMLGLLASPHELKPVLLPGIALSVILIFVARPIGVLVCLAPFRFTGREMAFVSWVGLRGAVPIYLAIIPVLEGLHDATLLFSVTFVIVILSLVVQGWTLAFVGRLLGMTLPSAGTHTAAPADKPT